MSADNLQQWRVAELTLSAESTYPNPSTDVQLRAIFSGPRGERYDDEIALPDRPDTEDRLLILRRTATA